MNIASVARTAASVALAFAAHAASAQPLASSSCFAAGNFTQSLVGTQTSCSQGGTVQDAHLDAAASRSTASASLDAGQMRSTSTAPTLVTPTGQLTAGSFSQTYLADTLTAHGPLAGPTAIVIGMHVDGSFEPSFYARGGNGTDVRSYLRDDIPDSHANFNAAAIEIALGATNEAYMANLTQPLHGSVQVGALDAIDDIGFDLRIEFVVDENHPSFSFRAFLETDALAGIAAEAPFPLDTQTMTADFGHTAQFYVMAPDGITLSSASGVFLTATPATPIPEPEDWLQMLAGFAVLGRLVRRRVGAAC